MIGFIGLGFMRHGMAKNLSLKGYDLWVKGRSNRVPVESRLALGAQEAGSPKEMAQKCDIIHICLSDSPQIDGACCNVPFEGPTVSGATAPWFRLDVISSKSPCN